jgi:mannosyl-glycoprotein endo-beta-N-acetylglucosaminidase
MNSRVSYFSHHTITLPPPSWITCCHANGTAVLGTVIFEWEAGTAACRKFLHRQEDGSLSPEAETFCDNLVALCHHMSFDGFLINIECALTPFETAILIDWLVMTRDRLKSRVSHGMLVWYDAVTIEGHVKWQNALNSMNKPFFDVCDSIFINYAWDQSAASTSASVAGDRVCDVFLGVDVFGRGTYGGGKYNSHMASAMTQVKYVYFVVNL